jgi:hypothetical protein
LHVIKMGRSTHRVAINKRLVGTVCHSRLDVLVVVITPETSLRRLSGSFDVLVRNCLWYNVLEKLEVIMM